MKIGNAGAFWGDDPDAPSKLISQVPDLDYLTMDYLAELSLSVMAAQRAKDPKLGYAQDFIQVIQSLIPHWYKGFSFKVITNAGGLNPEGLREEIQKLIPNKKVVAISGDDVLPFLQKNPENTLFRHAEKNSSLSTVKDRLISANAYLGADKIVEALEQGADVIVTGRVADPSLTVAPAQFHFKWKKDDYNKLAQATVAGHLIECGTQVTGGISTGWDNIDDPENIGFPYVEIEENGDFVITKPKKSSGKVNLMSVKEQLLYELGDPASYKSPDVTVSFLELTLKEIAPNQVLVQGAVGSPPPSTYKVSASFADGFKTENTLVFVGKEAPQHAKKVAQMILKKAPVEKSHVETYGDRDETFLRMAARDSKKEPLEKFLRAFAPLVTSGPPGTTGYTGARPKVRPLFAYWPCLIERGEIDAKT